MHCALMFLKQLASVGSMEPRLLDEETSFTMYSFEFFYMVLSVCVARAILFIIFSIYTLLVAKSVLISKLTTVIPRFFAILVYSLIHGVWVGWH